jgi:hypothetical protein
MLFASFVRWWYGPGWVDQWGLVRNRFDRTADFFSLELSLLTLFKPFRQIDAERARKGSLDVVLRALFDQLFSRFIGAAARTVLLVIGSLALVGEMLVGLLRLLVWPALPLLPLLAIPLWTSGWLPWL